MHSFGAHSLGTVVNKIGLRYSQSHKGRLAAFQSQSGSACKYKFYIHITDFACESGLRLTAPYESAAGDAVLAPAFTISLRRTTFSSIRVAALVIFACTYIQFNLNLAASATNSKVMLP
jgi:hypothetical protein